MYDNNVDNNILLFLNNSKFREIKDSILTNR